MKPLIQGFPSCPSDLSCLAHPKKWHWFLYAALQTVFIYLRTTTDILELMVQLVQKNQYFQEGPKIRVHYNTVGIRNKVWMVVVTWRFKGDGSQILLTMYPWSPLWPLAPAPPVLPPGPNCPGLPAEPLAPLSPCPSTITIKTWFSFWFMLFLLWYGFSANLNTWDPW